MHEILIDVKEVSGKAVPDVTSLQVAEVFKKRHDNVLRDIEHILSQVPENFIKLNFEEYAAEYRAGFGMRKTVPRCSQGEDVRHSDLCRCTQNGSYHSSSPGHDANL